ncbi:hypothetical protein ACFVS2_20655 [Brevibacillus sp. NPDC058079]|uniref:hypothetical protein n=1 Tax=Brevibacillus sp. NPDC058079 TaxID=3346330 RepID=UPI0036EB0BDC
MKTVQIRDENDVIATLKSPAVLYDKTTCVWHKWGDVSFINECYNVMKSAYEKHGFDALANDLAILELPTDQKLIDDLFQSSGRFEQFIKDFVKQ